MEGVSLVHNGVSDEKVSEYIEARAADCVEQLDSKEIEKIKDNATSYRSNSLIPFTDLGNTLPLARIAHGHPKDCKQALDSGAGGVIIPMIEKASQLSFVRDACRWPPSGNRGVGFSRANLFGKNFESYREEAQAPFLVAMIEHCNALIELEAILAVEGLDAILIGPYDLSASMGLTGQFEHPDFVAQMEHILKTSQDKGISAGIHAVAPSPMQLQQFVTDGYRFIAYSIDSVMLNSALGIPSFDYKRVLP